MSLFKTAWIIFCDGRDVNSFPRFVVMCLYWFSGIGFAAIALWPLWVIPMLAIYRTYMEWGRL